MMWLDQAACREHDPDLWSDTTDPAPALTVCATCPVLEQCAQWAETTDPPPTDIIVGGQVWGSRGRPIRRVNLSLRRRISRTVVRVAVVRAAQAQALPSLTWAEQVQVAGRLAELGWSPARIARTLDLPVDVAAGMLDSPLGVAS